MLSECKWNIVRLPDSYVVSAYNPISKSNITTRIPKFVSDGNQHTNLKDMAMSYIPGLVHSVDAATIRLIIYYVFKDCHYTIVTCHDSVQYHPNYECSLQEAIRLVYNKHLNVNIVEDLIVKPGIAHCGDVQDLSKHLEALESSYGSLNMKSVEVECESMYPLES